MTDSITIAQIVIAGRLNEHRKRMPRPPDGPPPPLSMFWAAELLASPFRRLAMSAGKSKVAPLAAPFLASARLGISISDGRAASGSNAAATANGSLGLPQWMCSHPSGRTVRTNGTTKYRPVGPDVSLGTGSAADDTAAACPARSRKAARNWVATLSLTSRLSAVACSFELAGSAMLSLSGSVFINVLSRTSAYVSGGAAGSRVPPAEGGAVVAA